MSGTVSCVGFLDPCNNVNVGYVGVQGPADIYVGETTTMVAGAETLNEFCPKTYPSSAQEPGLYDFRIADASIASVSDKGIVTGIAPGVTTLDVTRGSNSVVGSTTIWVARPIARVDLVVTPSTPKVGDTVNVVAQAIDGSGVVTTGAHFSTMTFQSAPSNGGRDATFLGSSATSYRIVVNSAGQYTFVSSVMHTGAKAVTGTRTIDVP
jgi:hypothetical protein